jgi:hypothetical protein
MRGEGGFGTIVGLVLLVLVSIALVKIVPLHIKGNNIYDSMQEEANFGSVKRFEKIQYDIYMVAQENGVPLPLNEVKISKWASNIRIEAKYEMSVKVLGYNYVYKFDKMVEKPVF